MSGSVEEQIIADSVEDNVGFTGTMELVNSHIKAVDMGATHVGRSVIKTVVDRLRPNIIPCSILPVIAMACYPRGRVVHHIVPI